MMHYSFPLMGLSRHRLGTDGQGVTTLVAAWGCPLRCRMCLNHRCWDRDVPVREVTADELYRITKVDDLYFQATHGGVTFGGGEPLQHAEFMEEFRKIVGTRWKVLAETSLNVPEEKVKTASRCVDEFMVDIKDMNPDIYRSYTGMDNHRTISNLQKLLQCAGGDRVLVRVPYIPGYNSEEDVYKSVQQLKTMGVERIDVFVYRQIKTRRKRQTQRV